MKNYDAGYSARDNIFVTNRNDMRRALNDAVRKSSGQADRGDNIEIGTTNRAGESAGTRSIAPGDRIITLRNARLGKINIAGADDHRKIDNGAIWTVEDIKCVGDGEALIALLSDGGRRILISSAEYNAFDHGYALTTHQAEGVTSKGLICLPSDMSMMDLHSWYVMLSRSRLAENTHVILPQRVLDEAEAVNGIESAKRDRVFDRLDSLLKAVERERYDHLSLSYVTRDEYMQGKRASVPASTILDEAKQVQQAAKISAESCAVDDVAERVTRIRRWKVR